MRGLQKLALIGICLIVAVLLAGCGTATAATPNGGLISSEPVVQPAGGITAVDLAFPGTKTELQMDLNGESAMLLLGGTIDAIFDSAKQQADVVKAHGDKLPPEVSAIVAQMGPLAGPVMDAMKDSIKSITHVTVLVMRPSGAVTIDGINNRYNALMIRQGWQSLLTVKAEGEGMLLSYIAPEGKGVFGVMQERQGGEIIVLMVTASKPLGDLVGQVIRTASPLASQFMLLRGQSMMPHPQMGHEVATPAQTSPNPPPDGDDVDEDDSGD
jgi:hypothetical protein